MFSYLRLFLLPLLLLLLVAQAEKGLFVLYNADQFSGLGIGDILYAMEWGVKFDLAVASVFAFFAYLGAYLAHRLLGRNFAISLKFSSFIAATLLLLLHGADLLYYGEAGRHLGYELKEGFNSGTTLATAALQTYTVPVVLQLLLLLPLYFFNHLLFRRSTNRPPHKSPLGLRTLGIEASVVIALLLSVVVARGGLASVPLEPLHAQEIGDSQRAAIALNGAYNAIFSSVTPYSVKPIFANAPTESELAKVRRMINDVAPHSDRPAQRHNVVMLLLESWSGAYMASYGYDKQTTPFFDVLRERSFTTLGMVAGGHRTTEGMFATLCSWQNPLGNTVAQTQLQNYDYDCLPELLGNQGYSTAFFQGTLENTSGTGAFARLLGFVDSYGKEDVLEHRYPYNSWGLQDPDLYSFVLKKLHQMPQPFFIGINSNSTHSTELPPDITPQFNGDAPTTPYINTLHFADAALGEFIHAVETEPAFRDTIFVLVADHAGHSPAGTLKKYLVPFLIYAPGLIEPTRLEVMSTQRDIAPTLLSLLSLKTTSSFSGSSLLQSSTHYADYYHQGVLGWVEGKRGIEIPLDEQQKMTCYELLDAPFRQQPDDCSESDQKQRQRALAFTHLSQSLLFNGKTSRFSQLHGSK
jgi:phosphoglycerol transferase MdoB-like AlkP superfamily enzyme